MNDFIKHHFELMLSKINSIENINRGGCGNVAVMLYPLMSSIMGLDVKIKVVGRERYTNFSDANLNTYEPQCRTIWEWQDYIDFAHVVLEWNAGDATYYVDSTGIHASPFRLMNTLNVVDPILYDGDISYDHLNQLVSNRSGWNSAFDVEHKYTIADHIVSFVEVYSVRMMRASQTVLTSKAAKSTIDDLVEMLLPLTKPPAYRLEPISEWGDNTHDTTKLDMFWGTGKSVFCFTKSAL